MSPADQDEWRANRRGLASELAEVRHHLQRHHRERSGAAAAPDQPARAPDGQRSSALDLLCDRFDLSAFERRVLVLCTGVELDTAFGPLCASAQGDPAMSWASFGLALAALPGADLTTLSPLGPLRYWELVTPREREALTRAPLTIDEGILHYLIDGVFWDDALGPLLKPVDAPDDGADAMPSRRTLADHIGAVWNVGADSGAEDGAPTPVVALHGPDAVERRAVAALALRQVGLSAFALSAARLPPGGREADRLLRRWERLSRIIPAGLVVEWEPANAADPAADAAEGAVVRLAERALTPVILSAPERRPFGISTLAAVEVTRPPIAEQRSLWRAALGAVPDDPAPEVEAVLGAFDFSADRIRASVATAAGLAATHGSGPDEAGADARRPHLWEACRRQTRGALDALACRIEPACGWNGLVLPARAMDTLRDMTARTRHRVTVYDGWGMGKPGGRGLGVMALFAGPSGTGKTLAAEVMAEALGFDLYRIDLAAVVNKYIGETEKNLGRLFDAADAGGVVLLFDEADALFGKRSAVKDSHDRYANIEVGYLLQRLEAYRGLAVLTTNLKDNLDPAFLRRLHYVVDFPLPQPAERTRMWTQAFPPGVPTHALDPAALARLDLTGGQIRNVALGAAFLAAEAGTPVTMALVSEAARREYAKRGRPYDETALSAAASPAHGARRPA